MAIRCRPGPFYIPIRPISLFCSFPLCLKSVLLSPRVPVRHCVSATATKLPRCFEATPTCHVSPRPSSPTSSLGAVWPGRRRSDHEQQYNCDFLRRKCYRILLHRSQRRRRQWRLAVPAKQRDCQNGRDG